MFSVFNRPFVGRRPTGEAVSVPVADEAQPVAVASALRTKIGGKTPKTEAAARRVLIVGAGSVGCSLAQSMESDGRYKVIGFLDDAIPPFGSKNWPVFGPSTKAAQMVEQHRIDEVVVAYAPTWQQNLIEHITANQLDVQVRVVPSYYEAMLCAPRMESMGDLALLPLVATHKKASDGVKRSLDICVALCGLVLLFPLTLITAFLIALTSPGPVLFSQERVGQYGKPFILLKFRTMRCDAETATGPVLSAGKSDPRLTPIGRWLRLVRLDEIPQLINVLKGEMSLVGPRPERPHFVEQFTTRNPLYARRHKVRPGITGLAQVHGGYHTDARDKLRFDLFYVSHHSVLLDISIMARTLSNILLRPDGC